jgi:cell division protein FtsN
MFQDRDGDSEILLGNKQLIGIFFVLAVLFAVFFTAGYMVGRSSGDRKAADAAPGPKPAAVEAQAVSGSGESHDVAPDPALQGSDPSASLKNDEPQPAKSVATVRPPTVHAKTSPAQNHAKPEEPVQTEERDPVPVARPRTSEGHNTYLQVTALGRAEADAVAKALGKKGFRTRVAAKPGTALYRVLVGPVRDAGDLNATRDALRSKGFREVFVQHL